MIKVLVLYTSLAAYFYKCIEELTKQKNVKVKIVAFPKDKNAPYNFPENKNIEILSRTQFNNSQLIEMVEEFEPDIICVSGWTDKGYKAVGKQFKTKIPVIVGLDNQWYGSAKQRIGSLLSPLYIHTFCNYVWVAGPPQYEFARRLGFTKSQILDNLYCANTVPFLQEGKQKLQHKTTAYPKTLMYLGRLIEHKGIRDLYEVMNSLSDQELNGWTAHLVGRGPLSSQLESTKAIKFHDFVQPEELPKLVASHGAFCLPSHFEHWGVVVQEAAAAGLPLVLSDEIGASATFLIPGHNGYIFKTGNKEDLKKQLLQLFSMSNDQLIDMGRNSQILANRIDHNIWIGQLLSTLN